MKKLFTSDKFFLATVLCAVIGGITYAAMAGIGTPSGYLATQLPCLICIACIVFLYASYQKHSKNVMKGLMGALLMVHVLSSITQISAVILPGEIIFAIIYVAVSTMLFISHFIINSDHHSKPGIIKFNQVLCIINLLNAIAWSGLWAVMYGSFISIICGIADVLYAFSTMGSIVCVESRLDAYRFEREAAGWTEEKGYPENYVHEYEKK